MPVPCRCWLDEFLSDRTELIILNSMVLVLSSGQLVMALSFLGSIYGNTMTGTRAEDAEDEMFTSWILLAILSSMCMLTALLGICAGHKVVNGLPPTIFRCAFQRTHLLPQVSIDLLVAYASAATFLLAPILLFTASSLEYRQVGVAHRNTRNPCRLLTWAPGCRCSKPGCASGGTARTLTRSGASFARHMTRGTRSAAPGHWRCR